MLGFSLYSGSPMKEKIEQLRLQFTSDLQKAANVLEVENVKVEYLGKKGSIPGLMQSLKSVSSEERPGIGRLINDLKVYVEDSLTKAHLELQDKEDILRFQREEIDVTLPSRKRAIGAKHLLMKVMDEMIEIFSSMGFSVQTGPQIDTEYYNFDVLNMPHDHSARDMQDTFFIAPGVLLRTHTSNVQGRVMESTKPPIRIISPGRAFRNEDISARSHVFFHQVEGLYVDENVTFQDLIYTLKEFSIRFFGPHVMLRFRPSYFPFVEPGTEVDIQCLMCKGKGCVLCKQSGWLEILGAGMVHPQVLLNGGIDPEKYQGYAWGMGIERPCMLKYGIDDIRLFSENDLRFCEQFPVI